MNSEQAGLAVSAPSAAQREEPPEAHVHRPQLGMPTVTVVNHFEAAMADTDGFSGVVAGRCTPARPARLARMLGVALTGAAVFSNRKPSFTAIPLAQQTLSRLEAAFSRAAHFTYEEHSATTSPLFDEALRRPAA